MNPLEKLQQLELPRPVAVIGAGVTGKSCVELLLAAGVSCTVFDEHQTPPPNFADMAASASVNNAVVALQLGAFDVDSFADYQTILLSPGVDTRRDCFAKHQDKLLTDIELFARLAEKPVIGVTGSNGKSTVVTLIYDVTVQAGKSYALCGNIGLPVLQALRTAEIACDGYIIELSSYQLERAPSLRPAIGVWLNVSPDHLDRYDSYDDYIAAKANLLAQSRFCVTNADDARINAFAEAYGNKVVFSRLLESADYRLQNDQVSGKILWRDDVVFDMADFAQVGSHHADNVMAVFAVAERLGIATADVATACRAFKPLASRAVVVAKHRGVTYINDSKGTNIGATAAALNGMTQPVILLAGGQGKGQDFRELAIAADGCVKAAVLFGEDAATIDAALSAATPCHRANDLAQAVVIAASLAEAGDVVMLSPACASFDMFSGYLQRGEAFERLVKAWVAR